jgi:hypothetical protein
MRSLDKAWKAHPLGEGKSGPEGYPAPHRIETFGGKAPTENTTPVSRRRKTSCWEDAFTPAKVPALQQPVRGVVSPYFSAVVDGFFVDLVIPSYRLVTCCMREAYAGSGAFMRIAQVIRNGSLLILLGRDL